jgi:hypothetical protein
MVFGLLVLLAVLWLLLVAVQQRREQHRAKPREHSRTGCLFASRSEMAS